MIDLVTGEGTKENPWTLQTPSRTSEYQAWKDETLNPAALVVAVGKTKLSYDLRCIEDAHAMLKVHGDWMALGNKDEQKPTKEGTLEHWARSLDNPIGGWYGLRKGYRGRFANYVTPVMEHLGLVELEHNKRNNNVRAI